MSFVYNDGPSDALLDLILGPDFCPQFNVHIDINSLAGSHRTDFLFSTNPDEVDIKDELEKVMKQGSFKSNYIIEEQRLDSNNNCVSNIVFNEVFTVSERNDDDPRTKLFKNESEAPSGENDLDQSAFSLPVNYQIPEEKGNVMWFHSTQTNMHRPTNDSLRKVGKKRRGVSILKPGLKKAATKFAQKHSMNKHVSKDHSGLKSIGGGKESKKDFSNSAKNASERMRRSELAMRRETLRSMLPHTFGVDKMGAQKVLEKAKDFCIELNNKASKVEAELRVEKKWNRFLTSRLEALQKPTHSEEANEENVSVVDSGLYILP